MLNTQKLLYILPDVAYVAELLPAKKANTFSIQSFRQINGEFMDDEIFKSQNIQKLFSKMDEGEFHLVLPDFLFTNTILNVTETTDAKVKEYINEKLLPKLDLSRETHELETFVLTEFKGVSKVQLSAIEKSLLAPIRVASDQNKVKISGISPLSWTIKSEISLEPSISVLQIGAQLYTALQYIGVDQATIMPVAETESVGESIKTLHGAEPNIQTVYLLTNAKVEEELKELVSKNLPLQQLTSAKDEDAKMPSYVKQIIESGMRTLSIEDYPVPKFSLGKATKDEIKEFAVVAVEDIDDEEDLMEDEKPTEKEEEVEGEKVEEGETEEIQSDLPTPIMPSAVATAGASEVIADLKDEGQADESTSADKNASKEEDLPKDESTSEEENMPKDIETLESEKTDSEPEVKQSEDEPIKFTPAENTNDDTNDDDDIDLSQFASHAPGAMTSDPKPDDSAETKSDETKVPDKSGESDGSGESDKPEMKPLGAPVATKKEVIKNSSGIGNMLKMVFITLAVFAFTVAVGVGAGLTLISMNSDKEPESTPTPVAQTESTPQPEPETTETASPSASINVEEISVLIVNATTKAGYAGTFKSALDKAGYEKVVAANAKGDYEEGFYVLMPEENGDLVAKLSEDADLELEFAEGYATEDTSKQYDAVIVLAK